MKRSILLIGAVLLAVGQLVHGFPQTWDPYLRYLDTQVTEVDVPDGATYWRVYAGDAVPPPDSGFGDVKIWFRAVNENGQSLSGIPIRVFSTQGGGTIFAGSTPGEFVMSGGNWIDFYNELGPYSLEVNDGQPSEACMGLGLPVNEHFSYTITFQRAIKGVTPDFPQPTPLGQPEGTNLLINPGAELGSTSGWSQNGISLNGDIFNNCGNREGNYRFTWQTFGSGGASLEQTVSVVPGNEYTFGFWVCKKHVVGQGFLNATWSDNGGGGGALYSMPGSEIIFPIYGTRQDATFVPQGDQVTVEVAMSYSGSEFAAFHMDKFWLVEQAPAGPPVIALAPTSFDHITPANKTLRADTFTVENSGESLLEYTITEDADWLSVDPASGTTATEADTITVSYDTAGLGLGTHQATITVTDPDATNSPQTIDVSVTIRVPGDSDGDDDVDQGDFGTFQVCLDAPGQPQTDPACAFAKLDDGDQDVDQDDYDLFELCMTGSDIIGDPACAGLP